MDGSGIIPGQKSQSSNDIDDNNDDNDNDSIFYKLPDMKRDAFISYFKRDTD